MKKLEDIPKKNVFDVPEGYFDRLPGVIQARVSVYRPSTRIVSWPIALRYAIPTVVLIAAGIFWFQSRLTPLNVEMELSSIQPDQLAVYLDDHEEPATEELVEGTTWSSEDLDQLENSVYSEVRDKDLLDQYDSEL